MFFSVSLVGWIGERFGLFMERWYARKWLSLFLHPIRNLRSLLCPPRTLLEELTTFPQTPSGRLGKKHRAPSPYSTPLGASILPHSALASRHSAPRFGGLPSNIFLYRTALAAVAELFGWESNRNLSTSHWLYVTYRLRAQRSKEER